MGGDIRVASNEGEGSTFTFHFKLESDYDQATDDVECSFGNNETPKSF